MASKDGLRRLGRGLSEAAFRARFGSEAACRQALLELRWRAGLACPACGHRGFCELKGRKVHQCNRCKKQVSLTAGTIGAKIAVHGRGRAGAGVAAAVR